MTNDTKNLTSSSLELMRLLGDPVRSRIYFEVLLQEEVNAHELMKHLTINRSTLTHHLTKMVEANILIVRVQTVGRPVKYYQLNENLKKQIVIEEENDPIKAQRQRIAFVQSVVAHMQLISNLARDEVNRLTTKLEKKVKNPSDRSKKINSKQFSFTFSLRTSNEMRIWNEKYAKFLLEVEEELKNIRGEPQNRELSAYIVFSGTVPIVRE